MGTRIETIQNYPDYIKCGEILKSPLKNHQDSIILKCFQCKEVHFLLETFIIHLQDHFKDSLTLDEPEDTKTQYVHHEDEIESEGVGIDNVAVKLEEVVSEFQYLLRGVNNIFSCILVLVYFPNLQKTSETPPKLQKVLHICISLFPKDFRLDFITNDDFLLRMIRSFQSSVK